MWSVDDFQVCFCTVMKTYFLLGCLLKAHILSPLNSVYCCVTASFLFLLTSNFHVCWGGVVSFGFVRHKAATCHPLYAFWPANKKVPHAWKHWLYDQNWNLSHYWLLVRSRGFENTDFQSTPEEHFYLYLVTRHILSQNGLWFKQTQLHSAMLQNVMGGGGSYILTCASVFTLYTNIYKS